VVLAFSVVLAFNVVLTVRENTNQKALEQTFPADTQLACNLAKVVPCCPSTGTRPRLFLVAPALGQGGRAYRGTKCPNNQAW
jgi:hypothetical protein